MGMSNIDRPVVGGNPHDKKPRQGGVFQGKAQLDQLRSSNHLPMAGGTVFWALPLT